MKNEFKICLRLMRYCLSKWSSILMGIVFLVLGLTIESLSYMGGWSDLQFFPISAGAIFLLSTAMFPSQMLVSVDVCSFAQTSSYKKKLQTSLSTKVLAVSMLLMFTLILILRCTGIAVRQGDFSEELNILPVTLFTVFIILYSGVVYKFFILSVVILYAVMMGAGFFYGVSVVMERPVLTFQFGLAAPVADIAISYVMIVAAAGLEYLISLALYRFPLSKYALRCSQLGK